MNAAPLTGKEKTFSKDDIIVSKTDLKGRITYANRTFIDLSGYTEPELIGMPHSILRHPDMPRCIFKLLWDRLGEKKEIFAYVVNRCKDGDHYWVFAHVTPSFNEFGDVVGYHSNRRVPNVRILNDVIRPLYASLLAEEGGHKNAKEGMMAGFNMLTEILKNKGVGYDEFIFSL